MKIRRLTPVIYTDDLQATVDFYINILGFDCLANDQEWGWARVRCDQADMMITRPNAHMPYNKAAFTGSFYFTVDNVDEIWKKVHQTVQVCYPR